MIRNIILLVFGFSLGYFIFGHNSCNEAVQGKKYDTLLHEIDTLYKIHDTIVYKKGKDIYHDTTIFIDIPHEVLMQVDTLAILRNFYAINILKDTLTLADSLGWVAVTDSIQKNDILGRNWQYNIKSKTIFEKTVLREKSKPHIYAGVGINGLATSIEGSILLQNKQGKLLQLGVVRDLNTNKNIGKVGLIWKIK